MMSEFYTEIIITPRDLARLELFTSEILDFTREAVELSENSVIIRTERDSSFIESLLGNLRECGEFDFTRETKANCDWIAKYKASIRPLKCARFYIYPPWDSRDSRESESRESCESDSRESNRESNREIPIVLEPSLAFGTGHHASSFMCIEALDSLDFKNRVKNSEMLDIGCGSGILALCAAKMGAVVDLCDIDDLAICESRKNFAANNAQIRGIFHGSIEALPPRNYDIITANLTADILCEIHTNLISRLKREGFAILSGILDSHKNAVIQTFGALKLLESRQKDEWICLILQKI